MTLVDTPSQNGTQTPVITTLNPPLRSRPASIFAEAANRIYCHRYAITITVGSLVGGVPRDESKLAAWISSKTEDKDDSIRRAVAAQQIALQETAMAADPNAVISLEEATLATIEAKHLNGFLGDDNGLYIEGRCIKAMLKEAASIRWAGKKWGVTRKGTKNYFAERVFVAEERVYLGRTAADRIIQRFVHSTGPSGPRTSISTEEVCDDVALTFTLVTDHVFTQPEMEDWLVTGEFNGVGATRSQGYGTFAVTGFKKIKV